MKSCEICGQEPSIENQTAVRCNGPCRCHVHAGCAKLTGTMLAGNGDLYWYCDRCRRGLQPVVASNRYDTDGSPAVLGAIRTLNRRLNMMGDSLRTIERAVKVTEPKPGLPELPAEMWGEIFGKMGAESLLQVRLVCRRWRGIVDGCGELIGKFTAIFEDVKIDDDYEPRNLLPVVNVKFCGGRMDSVGFWWTSFGPTLAELEMSVYYRIELPVLVEVLIHTPNLKVLKLKHLLQNENNFAQPNYQLKKVEQLSLAGIEDEQILLVILKLCCNVKSLEIIFPDIPLNSSILLRVSKIFGDLQNSLEELHLNPTDVLLEKLSELDRLKLKKLTLSGNELKNNRNVLELCRKQPQMEYFNAGENLALDRSNESDHHDLGQRLPKLKFLAFNLGSNCEVSLDFLSQMNRLQSLQLFGSQMEYNSPFVKLPALRELHLECITFPDDSLHKWLLSVPNLRSVTIADCEFDCWSDALEALESLKALQHLTLTYMEEVSETPFYHHDEFTGLKTLKIARCQMSHELFGKVLALCPHLRELCFEGMQLSEKELHIICRELTQLSRLTFDECTLPKGAADFVRENCHEIELKIVDFL